MFIQLDIRERNNALTRSTTVGYYRIRRKLRDAIITDNQYYSTEGMKGKTIAISLNISKTTY